jgi:hypothetical protein
LVHLLFVAAYLPLLSMQIHFLWRLRVDCDNSSRPKSVIQYWRNRIGIDGLVCIGTGGQPELEYAVECPTIFPGCCAVVAILSQNNTLKL